MFLFIISVHKWKKTKTKQTLKSLKSYFIINGTVSLQKWNILMRKNKNTSHAYSFSHWRISFPKRKLDINLTSISPIKKKNQRLKKDNFFPHTRYICNLLTYQIIIHWNSAIFMRGQSFFFRCNTSMTPGTYVTLGTFS